MQPIPLSLQIASPQDTQIIWSILKNAIQRRKEEGSNQWQDGYPNLEVITQDIIASRGYLIHREDTILGYVVITAELDPEYKKIEGKWLSEDRSLTIHRLAVHQDYLGQGIATNIFMKVEQMAREKGLTSIKVDTNFDNHGLLKILERLSYHYCGEVYFRGSARQAYEKVLV